MLHCFPMFMTCHMSKLPIHMDPSARTAPLVEPGWEALPAAVQLSSFVQIQGLMVWCSLVSGKPRSSESSVLRVAHGRSRGTAGGAGWEALPAAVQLCSSVQVQGTQVWCCLVSWQAQVI